MKNGCSDLMKKFIESINLGEVAPGEIKEFESMAGKRIKFLFQEHAGERHITKAVQGSKKYPNCQFQGFFELKPNGEVKLLSAKEVSARGEINHDPFSIAYCGDSRVSTCPRDKGPHMEILYRIDGKNMQVLHHGWNINKGEVHQVKDWGTGGMRHPNEINNAVRDIRATSTPLQGNSSIIWSNKNVTSI